MQRRRHSIPPMRALTRRRARTIVARCQEALVRAQGSGYQHWATGKCRWGAVALFNYRRDNLQTNLTERTGSMTRSATTLALLAGLALPAAADEEKQSQESSTRLAAARTTPEQPPEELKGFDGLLVG